MELKQYKLKHKGKEIDFLLDSISEKFGGSWVDEGNNLLYFFATQSDANTFAVSGDSSLVLAGPFQIGGGGSVEPGSTDFRFVKMPSGNSIYISGKKDYTTTVFVRSMKNGHSYDAMVDMSVNVLYNSKVTPYSLGRYPANQDFTLVVPQNIIPNGSQIQFKAEGVDDNDTTGWYNVTKESLSVTADGEWWKEAFVNGEIKTIPLTLSGSQFNLVCEVTNKNGYSDKVTRSSSSTGSSYNLDFHNPVSRGGASGVYTLCIYLESTAVSSLRSDELVFNVVCVDRNDDNPYLVCNNVGTDFVNYTTNRMFQYAVVGVGSHNVRFVAKALSETISDTTQSVSAGNVIDYNLSVEVETAASSIVVSIDAYLDGRIALSDSYDFVNRGGHNAVPNAVLSVRMNGRSNSQSNRETLLNTVGADVRPTWTNVGWYGADGYVTEDAGGKTLQTSLRLLSGSSMYFSFDKLLSKNCTLELDFRLSNVMDYDAPVIRCLSGTNGLTITPSYIIARTQSAQIDEDQVVNYDSEQRCHIVIVCREKDGSVAETQDNYSAVQVFIDGCIQRSFSAADMPNINSIVFGNSTSNVDSADIDLYGIRLYNRALNKREVEQNTANWKATNDEKNEFANRNDLRDGSEINFAKVVTLCNCIVFEADNLPDRTWEKGKTVSTKITTYKGGVEDISYTADVEWQGTTSHEYLRQNFKWKNSNGTKMCAKKNFASSMQSHKIGSVLAYTDLAKECGVIGNDERASIWQEPYVGFQKTPDGEMHYIGLYTVGPDKGDTGTFGFVKNKSVALEGLDNEPLAVNFRLPWITNETCYADDEAETYLFYGIDDKGSYVDVKSWEDAMKNASGVTAKWIPAYNFVYNCSQTIKPIASIDALNAINARQNFGTDFWTPDGTIYYYNARQRKWMANGKNVFRDVDAGKVTKQSSDDATNEAIKKARRDYFKAHVHEYFDKRFAFFHLGFVEFFGATDNLSKNTYPYIKDATSTNALVMWRQDDLDTIFDIENRGKSVKPYCVEIGDNYSTYGRPSQAVYNGTGNQFWLLMRECFGVDEDGREQGGEYYQFMRDSFIPGILKLGGSQEKDTILRAMAFFEKYYFDNAQKYFPEALYNEDARYCYETGHITSGYAHQADSLAQMLGNHYSAERYWVKMRFIYMSSKYTTNKFAIASQDDVFATRPYSPTNGGNNVYEVTPAIYMYPSIQQGNTLVERGERMYPGNVNKTAVFTLVSSDSSDMSQRINGMSYIRSLGKMYKNYFKENITIDGKMLKELSLGSRNDTSNINSVITGASVGTATSLRILDVSNIPTLGGNLDLTECLNLKEVYAQNTKITSMVFCDGGPLERVYYSSYTTSIVLRGKKNINYISLANYNSITEIYAVNCNEYVINALVSYNFYNVKSLTLSFGETEEKAMAMESYRVGYLITMINNVTSCSLSGYIKAANESDTITALQDATLREHGLTYIGNVTPATLTVVADKTTIAEGESVKFTATGVPEKYLRMSVSTVRVTSGSITADEVKELCSFSGNTLRVADSNRGDSWRAFVVVRVGSTLQGSEDQVFTITVNGMVRVENYTLDGPITLLADYNVNQETLYKIVYPSGVDTTRLENVRVSSSNSKMVITSSSQDRFYANVTTTSDFDTTLTVFAAGVEKRFDIHVKVVPKITILGPDVINAINGHGSFDFAFNVVPLDYTVDITNLTISSSESSVITSEASIDEGFSISVDGITEDKPTTLTMTFYANGNKRTATKDIDVKYRRKLRPFVIINPFTSVMQVSVVKRYTPDPLALYFLVVSDYNEDDFDYESIEMNYELISETKTFDLQRGQSLLLGTYQSTWRSTNSYYWKLNVGNVDFGGDILGLVGNKMGDYALFRMFDGCTYLMNPPKLPYTELAPHCYEGLFSDCSYLRTAPDLPATTMKDYCYGEMFSRCNSLRNPPKLPAMKLAVGCYAAMFYNIANFENEDFFELVELPAMELETSCYEMMFGYCIIKKFPKLPATKLAERCYQEMFFHVGQNGNYYQIPEDIPELPATKMERYCYYGMFSEARIQRFPKLQATELNEACYLGMFQGATIYSSNESDLSIELPAENLASSCYSSMFYNLRIASSGLMNIKLGSKDNLGIGYSDYWLNTNYAHGNVYYNPDAAWLDGLVRNYNTIPTNWNMIPIES